MANGTASNGRRTEYTELAKLRPAKSVSVFGYVDKAVYTFNKDPHGKRKWRPTDARDDRSLAAACDI